MEAKITLSFLMLACLTATVVHAMSVSVRQADNTETSSTTQASTSTSASSQSATTGATAATSTSASSQSASTGATAATVTTQTPDMINSFVRLPFQIAKGVADTGINFAQNVAEAKVKFATLPLRMFGNMGNMGRNFFPIG
ncbi:protein new-glue 1 [Anabrus simplex]|uniref:protein new-glue 1 n=1 Tax=Anabrus simplex TaxID=316456 RepID=UPI0035A339C4